MGIRISFDIEADGSYCGECIYLHRVYIPVCALFRMRLHRGPNVSKIARCEGCVQAETPSEQTS